MRMPVTEPTETAAPIADLSFDDALAELQRTIAELETGVEPAPHSHDRPKAIATTAKTPR